MNIEMRSSFVFSTVVTAIAACLLGACSSTTCGGGSGGDAAVAVCGNHVCEATETAASCPADCTSPPVCGNHVCETNERTTCPGDCPPPVCGNHVCDAGETPASCPADCASVVCGNGTCDAGETPASCPADCTTCGDHICQANENSLSCPIDCASACPSVAGNYVLSPDVNADPSCPPGPFGISVTQTGCSVTVLNFLPTPLTFTIDSTGTGVAPYSVGGESGVATFVFSASGFVVSDTGANAACPGFAVRS